MLRSTGCLILGGAALLLAADPAWKNKNVSEWTAEDARQVLASSPWVRRAEVKVLPPRSESQMREAGRMGMTKGMGLSALNPSVLTGVGGGRRLVPKRSQAQVLTVRWESARPVRSAEVKVRDTSAPDWDGDYYAIAVYGVTGLEDQKTLPVALEKCAFLRRDGKKDVRPRRVELLFDGDVATVLFLFPRTDGIQPAEKHVWFAAQIGSAFVEQSFDPGDMQLQGKLEL